MVQHIIHHVFTKLLAATSREKRLGKNLQADLVKAKYKFNIKDPNIDRKTAGIRQSIVQLEELEAILTQVKIDTQEMIAGALEIEADIQSEKHYEKKKEHDFEALYVELLQEINTMRKLEDDLSMLEEKVRMLKEINQRVVELAQNIHAGLDIPTLRNDFTKLRDNYTSWLRSENDTIGKIQRILN